MLKISFFLKKPDSQEKLESITIDSPKKILEGNFAGNYGCKIHMPDTKNNQQIYSITPIDTVCLASEFVKIYLQGLVARGFTVGEADNHES